VNRPAASIALAPNKPPLTFLGNAEIITELLGTRTRVTPGPLFTSWPESLLALVHLSESELIESLGVTAGGARRLALALELHRRLLAAVCPIRPTITTPEQVMAVLAPIAAHGEEHFWCLPLDPRSCLIGQPVEVSKGDVDGCDAGPRAVLRAALRAGAVGVIVAHNHPSADLSPSAADLSVTRRLFAAGKAVDVELRDHVLIAADRRFKSLRRDHPDCFR